MSAALLCALWLALLFSPPLRTALWIAKQAEAGHPALPTHIRPCHLTPEDPALSREMLDGYAWLTRLGFDVAPPQSAPSLQACPETANLVFRGWSGRRADIERVKGDGTAFADRFEATGHLRATLSHIPNTRGFYKRLSIGSEVALSYIAVSRLPELPHARQPAQERMLILQELLQVVSGFDDLEVDTRTASMIAERPDPWVLTEFHKHAAAPRDDRLWILRELEIARQDSAFDPPWELCLADDILLLARADLDADPLPHEALAHKLSWTGPVVLLRVLYARMQAGRPLWRSCFLPPDSLSRGR